MATKKKNSPSRTTRKVTVPVTITVSQRLARKAAASSATLQLRKAGVFILYTLTYFEPPINKKGAFFVPAYETGPQYITAYRKNNYRMQLLYSLQHNEN